MLKQIEKNVAHYYKLLYSPKGLEYTDLILNNEDHIKSFTKNRGASSVIFDGQNTARGSELYDKIVSKPEVYKELFNTWCKTQIGELSVKPNFINTVNDANSVLNILDNKLINTEFNKYDSTLGDISKNIYLWNNVTKQEHANTILEKYFNTIDSDTYPVINNEIPITKIASSLNNIDAIKYNDVKTFINDVDNADIVFSNPTTYDVLVRSDVLTNDILQQEKAVKGIFSNTNNYNSLNKTYLESKNIVAETMPITDTISKYLYSNSIYLDYLKEICPSLIGSLADSDTFMNFAQTDINLYYDNIEHIFNNLYDYKPESFRHELTAYKTFYSYLGVNSDGNALIVGPGNITSNNDNNYGYHKYTIYNTNTDDYTLNKNSYISSEQETYGNSKCMHGWRVTNPIIPLSSGYLYVVTVNGRYGYLYANILDPISKTKVKQTQIGGSSDYASYYGCVLRLSENRICHFMQYSNTLYYSILDDAGTVIGNNPYGLTSNISNYDIFAFIDEHDENKIHLYTHYNNIIKHSVLLFSNDQLSLIGTTTDLTVPVTNANFNAHYLGNNKVLLTYVYEQKIQQCVVDYDNNIIMQPTVLTDKLDFINKIQCFSIKDNIITILSRHTENGGYIIKQKLNTDFTIKTISEQCLGTATYLQAAQAPNGKIIIAYIENSTQKMIVLGGNPKML